MEPMNPDQFDYIIPYKQYCDYLRYTHPSKRFDDSSLRRRYDEYKESFQAKQLANFFDTNKDKQWFLEKYHPVLSIPRKQELKQRRLRYFNQFMDDLNRGLLDNVELDEGKTYTINNKAKKQSQQMEGDDDQNTNEDNQDIYENRLVIKTVLPTISRENILKLCETVDGFDYLALSEPGPNRRFHRIGWINFKEGTDMQQAFDQLDNKTVDDFVFHLAMNRKNQEPLPRTPRLALEISNTEERLKHDMEQSYTLAKAMDTFLDVKGAKQVVERANEIGDITDLESEMISKQDDNDNDDDIDHKSSSMIYIKKKLDLMITYLRRVHMMCYYCGLECDSIEDLDRKCMEPHCRKIIDKSTQGVSSSGSEKGGIAWAKNLDSKLALKFEKPRQRTLERMGGKLLDDELDKFYDDHIQREHSSKYRCKVDDCNKAFRGIEFAEKHITSKHPEHINRIKEQTTFYNNYICDPNHLTPQTNHVRNNTNLMNNVIGTMTMTSTNLGGSPVPMVRSATSLLDSMMPRDPRQVTSYVDLDAPAQGDNNGPVFY
ncbi:uncharacterized protein BX664DRAFT_366899 [Halteromyces radiatus]|uniref:uncharacterized protein n=1 Tax=Halteromyces radiatus TaxID=101107 RepID=UPI00221F53C9|nr:uncharacterized protein BX664DRAFT_366899 [Halteromyces radiatus]KAI8081664.1 hypothetical protein BX664DRAFT_366899 [Halteromyces radiatus]